MRGMSMRGKRATRTCECVEGVECVWDVERGERVACSWGARGGAAARVDGAGGRRQFIFARWHTGMCMCIMCSVCKRMNENAECAGVGEVCGAGGEHGWRRSVRGACGQMHPDAPSRVVWCVA